MQQQQQQQQKSLADDDNLSAQRAAAEALQVGRATLQATQQQSEQLKRTQRLADETQWALHKSGRLLRGMTWSGWIANMLSSSSNEMTTSSKHRRQQQQTTALLLPAYLLSDGSGGGEEETVIPASCQALVQSLRNYHANLQVLQECETEEQRETCQTICHAMYQTCNQQLEQAKTCVMGPQDELFVKKLESHLRVLRGKQTQLYPQAAAPPPPPAAAAAAAPPVVLASKSPPRPPPQHAFTTSMKTTGQQQPKPSSSSSSSTVLSSSNPSLTREQDLHLQTLSQNLGELGQLSQTLNAALLEQNATLDSLETQSDDIVQQTGQVTRRADRLVNYKLSWTGRPSQPKRLTGAYAIRHVPSQWYLSVVKNDVYLVPTCHLGCLFHLYKRTSGSATSSSSGTSTSIITIGIQNKKTSRWMGQSLLGAFSCGASSFGRREEWELEFDIEPFTNSSNDNDDVSKPTRLLCASVGWSAGGYVLVRPGDLGMTLGGCTVQDKQQAGLFELVVAPK